MEATIQKINLPSRYKPVATASLTSPHFVLPCRHPFFTAVMQIVKRFSSKKRFASKKTAVFCRGVPRILPGDAHFWLTYPLPPPPTDLDLDPDPHQDFELDPDPDPHLHQNNADLWIRQKIVV